MSLPIGATSSLSNAWDVFMLFLIPVGGGIPAGVLLARSRSIEWPEMMILYFFSDLILACLFEPLMRLVIEASKRFVILARLRELVIKSMKKTSSYYGGHLKDRSGGK